MAQASSPQAQERLLDWAARGATGGPPSARAGEGGTAVLDRIEGDRAVLLLESGTGAEAAVAPVLVVPLSELPPGAREGDWLRAVAASPGGGSAAGSPWRWVLDPAATEAARQRAAAKLVGLRQQGGGKGKSGEAAPL